MVPEVFYFSECTLLGDNRFICIFVVFVISKQLLACKFNSMLSLFYFSKKILKRLKTDIKFLPLHGLGIREYPSHFRHTIHHGIEHQLKNEEKKTIGETVACRKWKLAWQLAFNHKRLISFLKGIFNLLYTLPDIARTYQTPLEYIKSISNHGFMK